MKLGDEDAYCTFYDNKTIANSSPTVSGYPYYLDPQMVWDTSGTSMPISFREAVKIADALFGPIHITEEKYDKLPEYGKTLFRCQSLKPAP